MRSSRPGSLSAPRSRRRLWIALIAAALLATGFTAWIQWNPLSRKRAPTQGYTLVNTYPHDPNAYCQGLAYFNGFLYEGTGEYGKSSLRQVELKTGKVIKQSRLSARMFGEGITLWKDTIIQLTWKSKIAIVYDRETFRQRGHFQYAGQGWGLTHDGHQLIMSDGTAILRFLDPDTFAVQRQLIVHDGTRRVKKLNELEYVEGEIYANIWYKDKIARISPKSGNVLGWIDLSRLFPKARRPHSDAVLNGIAYDPDQRRLFVTGKDWPRLYEIRLSK